ncbi:MAG: archaeal proteasome endopeptidase complex subunit alpha [Desulfurococcaceae archaeon]|jgi:proteasome alpha subunit|nr:archaeal proteasome endopeptidase complex subunit alpha [Desulfurococcaceae archaeon]MCC6053681.1 archaeal proteasome endopeptidase complex subunit alpha [Desulfurococcaceae archaeon]
MMAAYDRAITIFAPDGRIYQVEYAFETVRRGWTSLGIKTASTSVIAAEKRKVIPLADEKSVRKIFKVDDHVGATYAGMAGDGRVLLDYATQQSLYYRLLYDEPVSVEYLVKLVCDVKQVYTQHAGVRPFGVAIIFAGVDERGVHLYMTEPSGNYIGYYAVAIGEKGNVVQDFLEKNYKYDLNTRETIKLAIQAITSIVENKPYENFIEVGYVDKETRKFKLLSESEIREYIEELVREGKIKA